jgi:hypothetical protein
LPLEKASLDYLEIKWMYGTYANANRQTWPDQFLWLSRQSYQPILRGTATILLILKLLGS